jgi:hypothetical protein
VIYRHVETYNTYCGIPQQYTETNMHLKKKFIFFFSGKIYEIQFGFFKKRREKNQEHIFVIAKRYIRDEKDRIGFDFGARTVNKTIAIKTTKKSYSRRRENHWSSSTNARLVAAKRERLDFEIWSSSLIIFLRSKSFEKKNCQSYMTQLYKQRSY